MIAWADIDYHENSATGTADLTICAEGTTVTIDGKTYRRDALTCDYGETESERDERRRRERLYARACLWQRLGAILDGERIRYWPAIRVRRRPRSQRHDRRPLQYWAGQRDWTRGRRWDRRHRYGVR